MSDSRSDSLKARLQSEATGQAEPGDGLSAADAHTPRRLGDKASTEVVARFRELARRWRAETRHLSSAARMAKHPAYQEIISMGERAIPLLLAELRREPDHWFVALHTITGANPVPPESEGKVSEMANAWVRWGEKGGYAP